MPLPSNGTSAEIYIDVACRNCRHDHSMHDNGPGPGCSIYSAALAADAGDPFPAWPYVDDHFAMACSLFDPCQTCHPDSTWYDIPGRWGIDLATARALRPAGVVAVDIGAAT